MRRSPIAITIVLALTLGCNEQQTPMAPTEPPTSSLVTRTTEHFGFGFDNGQRLVIIGATLENWFNFCATGEQVWDAWEIFTVTRPDESFKQTWKGESQNVLVWDLPADACVDSPDYTGTARMILTDSDVDLTGHGADASGHRVTGTVTDASGQRYHLHAVFLLTVAPEFDSVEEFFDLVFHKQKIDVKPFGQ
jgi:hypothetical protein